MLGYEDDDARIVVDGREDVTDVHPVAVAVGDLPQLHPVERSVGSVHVEGRAYDHQVLPGLSEDLHHVPHGHDAAVSDCHLRGGDPYHFGIFLDERPLLRVHAEHLRGDVLHDLVEQPSREPVRVLVLVEAYEPSPSLWLFLAEGALHIRIDIDHFIGSHFLAQRTELPRCVFGAQYAHCCFINYGDCVRIMDTFYRISQIGAV